MLAIVSDTHGTADARLSGRTREAIERAEHVIHAGDFTTRRVYEAFAERAESLTAVHGNGDERSLAERLPGVATVEYRDRRFVVTHGHDHTDVGLSMLGRQENADVIVVGHSHRPGLADGEEWLVVNPGSHADPRQYRAAHAEVTFEGGRLRVGLYEPDGAMLSEVCR